MEYYKSLFQKWTLKMWHLYWKQATVFGLDMEASTLENKNWIVFFNCDS